VGREGRRPEGYTPSLELYLRRKAEGGDLLVPSVFRGKPDALSRRACLVLIHGFNNTDSEAATAYVAFRARQAEINEPATALDAFFGDAFWPGDAHWWGWLDMADALIYPISVGTAKRAAVQVARLLWQMPNLQRVGFIAHSLGTRVVLETLLLLRERTLPMVERVCLMAPAVPSEMLEPRGRFFDLLRQMQAERTSFYVLHSMQDTVLHSAFPVGQQFAGAGEASSRALGRFGPTPLMPGYGDTLRGDAVDGAGHSHYWGHVVNPASRKATELAGIFLELGAKERKLSSVRAIGASRRIGS
jgi:pimeloyl-ACP methyl ester carboxylesterase